MGAAGVKDGNSSNPLFMPPVFRVSHQEKWASIYNMISHFKAFCQDILRNKDKLVLLSQARSSPQAVSDSENGRRSAALEQ